MITLETLRALQTDAGAELLAELTGADLSDANTLALLTRLRKRNPAEIAAAALETARLRIKGREKFGARADRMFFTREALEQASDWRVSRHRFGSGEFDATLWFADMGCGIGGDSLALAEFSGSVIGVDLDPIRLAMARANVPAAHALFIAADARVTPPFSPRINCYFFDPARRVDGRRIHSVHNYIPPLDVIDNWRRSVIVKLSPGIDLAELEPYGNTHIEFVSLNGELKEAVMTLSGGGIQSDPIRTAIVIDADGNTAKIDHRLSSYSEPSNFDGIRQLPQLYVARTDRYQFYGPLPVVPISIPRAVLYEPDPAVIRAGLVQLLGSVIGAAMIDSTIAYLTADQAVKTPFARAWPIEAWMPFNLKKLRAYLRERNVGRVTVKKRGSPLTPEELIAKLRLPGDGEERVVVLTRVQGNPAIIICGAPISPLTPFSMKVEGEPDVRQ